jgi:protein gp37
VADRTRVEWTRADDGTPGATWPIVTGCEHMSPGCDRCYAARLTAGRLRNNPAYAGLAEGGRFNGEVRLLPDRLDWPLHWRKPRRIFVCSMSDLFHKDVPVEFIARAWAVMAATPQHTYIVLTKRHARMRSVLRDECHCRSGHVPGEHFRSVMEWASTPHSPTYIPGLKSGMSNAVPWPLPNVWIGVSAEDQKWANIRIPALLDTPAAVRWVSAEPLLGPINLNPDDHTGHDSDHQGTHYECLACSTDDKSVTYVERPFPEIDWLVVGGETGPGARPVHPDWIRSLRDQCVDASVPFYLKQWGDWLPLDGHREYMSLPPIQPGRTREWVRPFGDDGPTMCRIGKRHAGRVLDGRTWDQYPPRRTPLTT